MSSPSDRVIKSKGRKKKDRIVDRHKTRTCPNCYTSLGKNYARHLRACNNKPSDLNSGNQFGFAASVPRDR
jgi:hypothetical protein